MESQRSAYQRFSISGLVWRVCQISMRGANTSDTHAFLGSSTDHTAPLPNTTTVVMRAHETWDESVAGARVVGNGFDGPRVASRLAKGRPGQPHLRRTRR